MGIIKSKYVFDAAAYSGLQLKRYKELVEKRNNLKNEYKGKKGRSSLDEFYRRDGELKSKEEEMLKTVRFQKEQLKKIVETIRNTSIGGMNILMHGQVFGSSSKSKPFEESKKKAVSVAKSILDKIQKMTEGSDALASAKSVVKILEGLNSLNQSI